MTIGIIDKTNEELFARANSILHEIDNENESDYELQETNMKKLVHLIQNSDMEKIMEFAKDREKIKNFNYANLNEFHEKLGFLYRNVDELKQGIDLDKFYRNGKIVDWKKLRKEYVAKGLDKIYNFDWVKLKDWINNPRLELQNVIGETIRYDPYVVKKTNLAIIQIFFNEMDIYELIIGPEGTGKSCFSSQRVLYYYTFLYEIGAIDYFMDIKRMYFTDVAKLLEKHEMEDEGTMLQIECLDESNKLNRQNYREDESLDFKAEMRTERKNQRIMLLNMQQIGEMDTSVTLTRVNFIFYCDMDSNAFTGTLKKGNVDMIIIPRGKKIYSQKWKKELYRSEIKERLSKFLESKSEYYKDLPEELVVKSFRFENIWGFDKKLYEKHTKGENKRKRLSSKDLKITDYLAYIIYKKCPPLKSWDLDRSDPKEKKMYMSMAKFMSYIKFRLASMPELEKRFDMVYGGEDK